MNAINYKNINETLHIYEHKSGLKAFVVPKKGYYKKYATFSTKYGSIDNHFRVNNNLDPLKVPDGIAHFLEHKIFEQKDGSVMEKFAALGAQSNAYTSFSQTVYLFSCTDNFSSNLNLLLNFVQNPYITDESVEKEKDIIAQEIKMYQDDPNWRVFFNLMTAFYKEHPIKIDIAGTIKSIQKINREILYTCYNTFYHPSNMIILIVGDVDPDEVFENVEKSINVATAAPKIERIFKKEDQAVCKKYIEQDFHIAMPIFQLGFKDSVEDLDNKKLLKRELIIKILLEMMLGRSSALYDNLYNQGLINDSFDGDYTIDSTYAFSIIGGESKDPLKVKEIILKEIEEILKKGFDKKDFERVLHALKGKALKQLNSVERISRAFISIYFRDIILFDYYNTYDTITINDINKVFAEHFREDALAMSVVRPNK